MLELRVSGIPIEFEDIDDMVTTELYNFFNMSGRWETAQVIRPYLDATTSVDAATR